MTDILNKTIVLVLNGEARRREPGSHPCLSLNASYVVSGFALSGAKETRGTSGQRDWSLTSQKNNSTRQRIAQLPSTSPASTAITAEGMSRPARLEEQLHEGRRVIVLHDPPVKLQAAPDALFVTWRSRGRRRCRD